jgi:hypothetical protein
LEAGCSCELKDEMLDTETETYPTRVSIMLEA